MCAWYMCTKCQRKRATCYQTTWNRTVGNKHASLQQKTTKLRLQNIQGGKSFTERKLLTFWEWSTKYNAIASANPKPTAWCNQRTNSDKCEIKLINTCNMQHTASLAWRSGSRNKMCYTNWQFTNIKRMIHNQCFQLSLIAWVFLIIILTSLI